MAKSIDKLIINTPREEPKYHWFYNRGNRDFYIKDGRRPAGYVMATPESKGFDDPGIFIEIETVNKIRPRVKTWRESGYSGATGITKRLLEHWQNNDEAHHAWRVPAESKIKGVKKEDIEESTIWVGGLDRIHDQRNILRCFDLSATPFSPSGKKSAEEALFTWIVSDFGLNDAIESGLVKTPRVVVRDNSIATKELKSRLYHIYADDEVKDDINRKADETESLPDLLRNAYYLLGEDWLKTKKNWKDVGHNVPPVMITVANRTETSSRIKYAFDHNQVWIPELCVKNDHLGFSILYNFKGVIRKYYPDFLIRLENGEHMILETKGKDNQQNRIKREYLNEWVEAVNVQGGFGKWHWDVSFEPSDIKSKIKKYL